VHTGEQFQYWDPTNVIFKTLPPEDNISIANAIYREQDTLLLSGDGHVSGAFNLVNSNFGARFNSNCLMRRAPIQYQFWDGSKFVDYGKKVNDQILNAICTGQSTFSFGDVIVAGLNTLRDYATGGWHVIGKTLRNVIRKPENRFQYGTHANTVHGVLAVPFVDYTDVDSGVIANAKALKAENVIFNRLANNRQWYRFEVSQLDSARVKEHRSLLNDLSGRSVYSRDVLQKPPVTSSFAFGVRDDVQAYSDEVNQIIRSAVYFDNDKAYFHIGEAPYKITNLRAVSISVGPCEQKNVLTERKRQVYLVPAGPVHKVTREIVDKISEIAFEFKDLVPSYHVYVVDQSPRFGQQPGGTMSVNLDSESGLCLLYFFFPEGVDHDSKQYEMRHQSVYLQKNFAGLVLLELFVVAFNRGLLFKLGKSQTGGGKYWATIGGIPLKTAPSGRFGYDDEPSNLQYLIDALRALKLNGVTLDDLPEPVKQQIFGPQRP